MTVYAQTNIQLYNQLAELGYTAEDARRDRRQRKASELPRPSAAMRAR